MTRSFSLPESGYKAPRQHTTVTIRRPMIPKVDALVELYRKNTGQPLTRTDVVGAILMDAYNDFIETGLMVPQQDKE